MQKIKIKFYAITIGWTEGGIMRFSIKASAGSKISVGWGDGKVSSHVFNYESKKDFYYNYFPRNYKNPPVVKFPVEISCDNPDCQIFDFDLNAADMMATDLDISNCPELETLCFSASNDRSELDLSHNTKLKFLYCNTSRFSSLDLSHNTALEELHCRSNSISHLSLVNNYALRKLDCSFNQMEQLFIYYAPHLTEVNFEDGNNIDDTTKAQIYELVASKPCTKNHHF